MICEDEDFENGQGHWRSSEQSTTILVSGALSMSPVGYRRNLARTYDHERRYGNPNIGGGLRALSISKRNQSDVMERGIIHTFRSNQI